MLALSPIPLFDRKTIPPSRPAVPGARRRVAVKEGRRPSQSGAKRPWGPPAALRRLARAGVRLCFRFPRSLRASGNACGEARQQTRRQTRQPSGSCSTGHGPKARRLQLDW